MNDRAQPFESRRLEALSNTIFGVAMTLLAYQTPKDGLLSADPSWLDLWHSYGAHLSTLLLSFIVAGLFWYSHQRRLVYAPEVSRREVIVNLFFLLSIIVLPVTQQLYGSRMDARNIATLYSLNLALISVLNTILWLMAAVPRRDWIAMVAPLFVSALFVFASFLSLYHPYAVRFVLPFAFISPVLMSLLERKKGPAI